MISKKELLTFKVFILKFGFRYRFEESLWGKGESDKVLTRNGEQSYLGVIDIFKNDSNA